jgi:hypothetical protein
MPNSTQLAPLTDPVAVIDAGKVVGERNPDVEYSAWEKPSPDFSAIGVNPAPAVDEQTVGDGQNHDIRAIRAAPF